MNHPDVAVIGGGYSGTLQALQLLRRGDADRAGAAAAGQDRLDFTAERGGGAVEWRPRGSDVAARLETARIVDCTGPQMDISRAGEPLLDRLLETGRIRPDVCRIGIDVDAEYRTLDSQGYASRTLQLVGPMTRGVLWEVVAVPDIRSQVQVLASRLAVSA